MINVFLNEEYGYKHWWWEYPGTLDDLVIDWNTGNAPFLGKPYQGTLTQLPTDYFDPENPLSAAFAGRQGSYTIRRKGQEPVTKAIPKMDDFFHAFAEVDVEQPYLRIGDVHYPAYGNLLFDEEEVAKDFNWADWSEDPEYYRRWFEKWKKSYSCGNPSVSKIRAMYDGMLSPQESETLGSHVSICSACRSVWKAYAYRD